MQTWTTPQPYQVTPRVVPGISISPPDLAQRFIITPSPDFSTSIEALMALEKNNPTLQVSTKVTQQGDFILQAKNEESFYILADTTLLNSGKCISLKPDEWS